MEEEHFGSKIWHVRALALMLVGLAIWIGMTQRQLAEARILLKVYEEHAVQNSRANWNVMQFRHELMQQRIGRTNQFTGPQ